MELQTVGPPAPAAARYYLVARPFSAVAENRSIPFSPLGSHKPVEPKLAVVHTKSVHTKVEYSAEIQWKY